MKVSAAEKKLRGAIAEIRKTYRNKKWCQWADAWLSGSDRTAESAVSIAETAARRAPKPASSGRAPSPSALLSEPAGNAALAAAIIARSSGGELDQFASMMLDGYLKPTDQPVSKRDTKPRRK